MNRNEIGEKSVGPAQNGNGNGKKFTVRDAIQLLAPAGVFAAFLYHMGGTVQRTEADLSSLRLSLARIEQSVAPDIADGIRREIRVTAIERRVDACCPYYGGKR